MLKKIAAVLALVLVGVLGASAPAQAASGCPSGSICWYDRSDWTGHNYVVNPFVTPANTCFNMGVDPSGFNWDRMIDSVWWNASLFPAYAEFYEGPSCSVRAVTRVYPYGFRADKMQSCTEPFEIWKGPCAPPSYVPHRIRSWAFAWA
jgi:hypothetical protein